MHDPTNPLPELPLSQRETVDLAVEPEPKRNQWLWLIDRNPLFLISGVCMLGGCYLVSGAIHAYDPAEVGEGTLLIMLVALLAILNVYEFAVIWLGLALSRSKTLVRDTRHLLGLALLLLVDAAFVYNETSIFKPEIGGLIAAAAAVLALIKAGWITRSLGIRPTRQRGGGGLDQSFCDVCRARHRSAAGQRWLPQSATGDDGVVWPGRGRRGVCHPVAVGHAKRKCRARSHPAPAIGRRWPDRVAIDLRDRPCLRIAMGL